MLITQSTIMKKSTITLAILLLITALTTSLFAQRFTPTVDTYIDQNVPGTPNGAATTLVIKNQDTYKRITFMEFDIADFSEQVSKAELCLYVSGNSGTTGNDDIDVFEVTAGTITNTITWTNFNAAYTLASTPITSLPLSNGPGWRRFDIKNLVNTVALTSGSNKKIKIALKARGAVLRFDIYASEVTSFPQYAPTLIMTPAMPAGIIEKSRTAVVQDGYVDSEYPTSAYDNEKLIANYYNGGTKLYINANLRFNILSSAIDDNKKVTIKTKVKSADTGTNTFVVDLKGINNLDDATDVNTLTWNTMPAAGAVNYTYLRSRFFGAADKTDETNVEWDVTNYVKAQKTAGKTYANFSLQVPELGFAGGYYLSFYSLNYLSTHLGSTYIPELIIYDLPLTLTTQVVTGITASTAVGNGNIVYLGSPNPTQYGLCWNTSTNPTIANFKSENGAASATGAFTSNLTSLTPNTTYYVKAYATSGAVTTYGNEVTFTTLYAAPISTAATSVGATTFNATWQAPTQVPASYTYTVEYGTVSDLSSGTTTTSVASGTLIKAISGLTGNTNYYYRVKVVSGIVSGDWSAIQSLLTKPGTVTSAAASAITATGFTANWTALNSGTAPFTYRVKYSTSSTGPTYVYVLDIPSTSSSVAITGLNANTIYYYWVYGSNATGISFVMSATQTVTTLLTPIISGAATATAFTTTYGTASSAQTFAVSGSNLGADIIATAPAGFEVSSDGTAYAGTATFTKSGNSASGTLSVRLKANAAVSGSYNSQNIVLTSTWATTINIVTAASGNVVSAKTLTIGDPSIASKEYDGTTTAGTVTTGSLSGLVNVGDITATAVANNYSSANIGSYAGTTVVYTLHNGIGLASNYSLENGSATGEITALTRNVVAADDYLGNSALLAVTDITVQAGKKLTVDNSVSVHSIIVNPGAKLTINNNMSLTGPVTLQSSTDGTATLVDSYSIPTLNAKVEQYVEQGRNWYMSSPITAADYTVLNNGVRVVEFNESTKTWENVTAGNVDAGKLIAGKGYIQVANATEGLGSTGNISFSGTTNSGDVTIKLYRSGTSQAGFNLVGNPYPSYLDWSKVIAANTGILPTLWFRTKKTVEAGGAYTFATVNLATPSSPIIVAENTTTSISKYIPPMQAYWVRANSNNIDYKVTNDMRDHFDVSGNKFKAPKQTGLQLLRLQVSNATNSDEAIVYFNTDASNDYDRFDSPKMSNNSASIPEIYTLAGTEQLVINGLNDVNSTHDIPLGFRTGESNTFTLKASEISNFEAGTQVYIKDLQTNTNYELTGGSSYTFTSDIVNSTNRFSILVKAPSITTDFRNNNDSGILIYEFNNEIIVNCLNVISGESFVTVHTIVGSQLFFDKINSSYTKLKTKFASGIYLVTVKNAGKSVTKRIVIH